MPNLWHIICSLYVVSNFAQATVTWRRMASFTVASADGPGWWNHKTVLRTTKVKARRSMARPRGVRRGRPYTGLLNEDGSRDRVSDYATLTVRLPQRTRALISAFGDLEDRPTWRVIDQVFRAYLNLLEDREPERYAWVTQRYRQRMGAEQSADTAAAEARVSNASGEARVDDETDGA